MRRLAILVCTAAALAGLPAAPAPAASHPVQLARAGIGTSRFGGYGRSYRTYRPSYRYGSRGYGRGFFHGLFTGWFFSHFFGYGFGFGFPLWPFLLLLLVVWMRRPRGRDWR